MSTQDVVDMKYELSNLKRDVREMAKEQYFLRKTVDYLKDICRAPAGALQISGSPPMSR